MLRRNTNAVGRGVQKPLCLSGLTGLHRFRMKNSGVSRLNDIALAAGIVLIFAEMVGSAAIDGGYSISPRIFRSMDRFVPGRTAGVRATTVGGEIHRQ